MSFGWREPARALAALTLATLAALAVSAVGAAPLAAQRVREFGVHATATASDPLLGVAGLYGAVRLSSRVRLAATLGAGVADDEAAYRGELLGHFLLNPSARRRPGLYLGGGVAGVGGAVDQGYVVLLVGLEGRPGAGSGWMVEAGVGGGARVSIGYRWRRLP